MGKNVHSADCQAVQIFEERQLKFSWLSGTLNQIRVFKGHDKPATTNSFAEVVLVLQRCLT